MLVTGAVAVGVSVSARSRGTISKDSASGSSALDACLSHCSSAAALAAPVSTLAAGGALGVSTSVAPSRVVAVLSSVKPALAMVGSVATAGVSDSGALGSA